MPRASFSAAAFSRAADPGLGKLASAISGDAFEQGRQGEILFQSKLANALAQQRNHDATADLNTAKAEGERSEQAARTPEALQNSALLSSGIPLEDAGAVDTYFKTGQMGGKYAPAADGMGPVVPAPDYQGRLGDVARAIAGVQQALAIGDKNSENIAKAGAIGREGRLSDDIIAGRADRNTVGGAQAAAGGKDLFHADSTGSVLDRFTGNLDTSNPMAGSEIALRNEQAGNQRAGAAAHYASADNSRASAEKTRRTTPAAAMEAAGVPGANGDAFLKTLPQQTAAQVKALAEGRMAFPAGFALKSEYWQDMLSKVSQYDPAFDAVNYTARAKTRSSFTSGKEAQSLNALNTVMGHLDDLDKASQALGNTSFPLYNKAANVVGGQISPELKGKLNAFKINAQAVASELERAYRGTGGNMAEIEEWKRSLDMSDSPVAIRAALTKATHLLGSKIDALGDQYNKGMGTTKNGLELLTPKAGATYTRLAGEPQPAPAAGGFTYLGKE